MAKKDVAPQAFGYLDFALLLVRDSIERMEQVADNCDDIADFMATFDGRQRNNITPIQEYLFRQQSKGRRNAI